MGLSTYYTEKNVSTQQPMMPKVEWPIDSEALRVRGIIVLVKSNQFVKNSETQQLQLAKRDSAAIVLVFKVGAFRNQQAITQPSISSTNQNAALIINHQLEMIFHSHANKTHFHKKGCVLGLILKVRIFGTRNWPITGHFSKLLRDSWEQL